MTSRLFKQSGGQLRLVAVFVLAAGLVGCDPLALLRAQGGPRPKPSELQRESAPEPESIMSPAEKLNFHRWMAKEMIQQVLGRAPKNNEEVNGWANVFSQRGSVEGVYRGIVLSTEYAALENGKADMRALRFFAMEMGILDNPTGTDKDPSFKKVSEGIAQDHMRASVFVLKRVLGDKVLEETVKRKDDKLKLAAWYAAVSSRWAKLGVSFGLPDRNKPEEVFHFNWAKENNLGMIQWELLNKAHRLMNAYGGVAANQPVSPPGK